MYHYRCHTFHRGELISTRDVEIDGVSLYHVHHQQPNELGFLTLLNNWNASSLRCAGVNGYLHIYTRVYPVV